MSRSVITGVGSVTGLGLNSTELWNGIRAGEAGIDDISLFDVSDYECQVAGQVDVPGAQKRDDEDRANLFLRMSAGEALEDAGLDRGEISGLESSVLVGTAHGSLYNWEQWYQDSGGEIPAEEKTFSLDNLSAKFACDLGMDPGDGQTVSTACTSSTIALGMGSLAIRSGEADVVVVGGVDVLSEFVLAGFSSVRAVTSSTNKPFDRDRDGLILGEGGAVVVLESQKRAESRGATAYCEVEGFSTTADAENFTAPDFGGEGTWRCMENALADAEVSADEVSYVNAHGTGTAHNDRAESIALRRLFGDAVDSVPISSIKPFVGHTSGACGVIEAVVCSLSIRDSFVPPTLNFEQPEEDFRFDIVTGEGRETDVDVAISLNAAFGGSNACLVFEKI